MAEKCTWIIFQAHPTHFVREDDHHPDFFGVFVCPLLRDNPEQLLREILSNRHLFLAEMGDAQLKSMEDDWGMNERLKAQLSQEGFGLSLTKMHQATIPLD